MDDLSYDHLLVKREGDLVTVTLNRPEKRNALSVDVMLELTAALRGIGRSDALGVILAANGPVFSAGHNFGDMLGATFDDARYVFDVCADMMRTVQAIPQPVCAKVHAFATAAGCQLVASCDLAIAAESAAFALPGGKGGLFCHTPLVAVARNLGRKRALEMALTGDPIDAATAADWGLINRAVPDDELDAAVEDLMRRATRGSASSKALGKRTFYTQIDLDQAQAYEYATEVMAAGAATADGQEGIAAFLEKRRPEFPPPQSRS
jgi:enoyl-CoA hydratase/carnithine racemase